LTEKENIMAHKATTKKVAKIAKKKQVYNRYQGKKKLAKMRAKTMESKPKPTGFKRRTSSV
jgi:hypothetical protein